jgi:oligopeptide transport system ATP-binding protein
MSAPLLEVRDLVKHHVTAGGLFGAGRRVVRAVDGVSLTIAEGETLGLVGESGCGKSTLARTVLLLEPPTSGEVRFDGEPLTPERARALRRRAQIVFQDPWSSLPPRMRVGRIVGDPLEIHGLASGRELAERVRQLLVDVGLRPADAERYPHEMSGGQRQRVGIARALAVQPSLIVADEAVSSLDVSVRAQILNLLRDLQERHRLAYLFVSHDLGVVRYMSHRIAVMYLGRIVETASAQEVYARPLHPYTRALMAAAPSLHDDGRERFRLQGEPPDPSRPPSGCRFHPRCPMARERCAAEAPGLVEWLPGRQAACHFALEEPARGQPAAGAPRTAPTSTPAPGGAR